MNPSPPPPPILPPWLHSTKHHLLHTSPSITLLRSRALQELKSRLPVLGRLHPGGLAAMPVAERDGLVRSVAEAVKMHAGEVWGEAVKEVERVLDERLAVVGWGGVVERGGGDEERLRILLRESERGAAAILSRWPDAKSALRACLNVPLPKDLRRAAWTACLKDNEIVQGCCQSHLSSNKIISQLATQYRCVKRMEQSLMYLLESSSCPTLRSLGLAFRPLPVAKSVEMARVAGEETVKSEFWGGLPAGEEAVKSEFWGGLPAGNNDDKSVEEEEEDEDYESGHEDSTSTVNPNRRVSFSSARRRQLAIMIPFIKAFEMDAPLLDPVWGGGGFGAVDDDGSEGEGFGGVRGDEEMRTAKVVEAVARFWAGLPGHWRMDGDYFVHQIAVDVEAELQVADFDLCNHILKLI
ncbi:hypothetical protein HDU67_007175, partial [Dinochytrium kinnereticum]